MKSAFGHRRSRSLVAPVALALLALALRVLVPQGFMVSDQTRDGRPAVVICTGHGPLQLAGPHDKAPASKSKPGAACDFAGGHSAPTPQLMRLAAPNAVAWAAPVVLRPAQAPGLGLAAPPPPAIGPPQTV